MAKRKHRRGRRKKGNWFSRLTKGKKVAVCVLGIFLCLALAIVIFVAAKLAKINSEDIPVEDITVNQDIEGIGEGYTTVALFGIDSRSGELEIGTRTDCIIVASLNNQTKEVRMVSVYRDTILDIKDNYLQKCNAAYSFGGPTQAINMLNKNLDLTIQDYATVDFSAISTAIDMLGGIEIDIKPEEIAPLNKYVGETARVAGKTAKKVSSAGIQLLDGVQATTYARIRSTAGGDFTRTERQRLVIEKIIEKAQQTNLTTINNIIDEVFPTIKTSFSSTEILSYAKDFMKYDIGESSGFPFEKTTATISGLGSIVIPVTLADNVSQLHEFLYDVQDYVPSSMVNAISGNIVARVGQREATDYSTLSNQTYVDTEEDRAQENNQYSEPVPVPDSGNNGNSGDNESDTEQSGNTLPDTGGTTVNPDENGNNNADGENTPSGDSENEGGSESETPPMPEQPSQPVVPEDENE